jgi:hypothetical protein
MTTSTTAASNCFIDLATFAELEGFLYGGPNAITWFVASVQKGNWFSYIPISLRHVAGTPDFGQRNVAASVNRSGDYVLAIWFRAQIPLIGLVGQPTSGGPLPQLNPDASIRWTRNLMHNLFEKVQISFNELIVQEFDNYWLDNNYQLRLEGAKRIGYRNMIGDIAVMYQPKGLNTPLGTGGYFSCPFPFWFCEDSGIALPVAALPFNDIKVNYHFRRWQELVVVNPGNGAFPATVANVFIYNDSGAATTQEPYLIDPQTYAHYVVVHNDERVKMGDAPRDMLIHQIQEAQLSPFKDVTTRTSFDIRMSHAIVCFVYMAENISWFQIGKGNYGREMSNYTTEPNYNGLDPIAYTQLLYESTPRLAMGSDYFSLIQPYYMSTAIPEETGYHFWSYALHPWDTSKPSGSTNYSKLANVSIVHDCSPAAINAANTTAPVAANGTPLVFPPLTGTTPFPQSWRHVFLAKNWNIGRIANGSFGQPTL